LMKRVYEHKNKLIKGFTSKYNLTKLVYYETMNEAETAIRREKQLKNWHREWKINLIESINKNWKDLSEEFSDFETKDAETKDTVRRTPFGETRDAETSSA